MSNPGRLRLLALLAGFAFGTGAAWALRKAARPPLSAAGAVPAAAGARAPAAPRVSQAAATLVLPPRLAPAEADAALDAWLALPPLPAKSLPAEIVARADSLRALLTILPTGRFGRLLSALGARLGEAERSLRWIAFDVWLERDAAAAARWAAALVPGEAINAGARARYAAKAALAWADSDFPAAFAWAGSQPDPGFARELATQLLARLAATDPVRALSLAEAGGPGLLDAARLELFRAWSDHDPVAAVRTLGVALLGEDRNEWYVREAIGKWVARAPRDALAWLGSQPGLDPEKTDSLLRNLAWSASGDDGGADPRLFAEALAASPGLRDRTELLSSLLSAWSGRAPEAALAWLDTIPDAARRADLLERAIQNFSSDRPGQNLALILRLPAGTGRDARVADIIGRWAKNDPDAALAWLHDHDDPSLASAAAGVQGVLIGALAATDPVAALGHWQELPADESRAAAAPSLATAWSKTDPAAASRWLVEQLPPLPVLPGANQTITPQALSDLQRQQQAYAACSQALVSTLASWSQKDPAGTLQWAESLADPRIRQSALDSLVAPRHGYGADTPDRAERADLLTRIKDPALRTSTLSSHLENWLRSDLASARAWIESHDAIAPEEAARLLANAGVTAP